MNEPKDTIEIVPEDKATRFLLEIAAPYGKDGISEEAAKNAFMELEEMYAAREFLNKWENEEISFITIQSIGILPVPFMKDRIDALKKKIEEKEQ